jgi:hypothetical protein
MTTDGEIHDNVALAGQKTHDLPGLAVVTAITLSIATFAVLQKKVTAQADRPPRSWAQDWPVKKLLEVKISAPQSIFVDLGGLE